MLFSSKLGFVDTERFTAVVVGDHTYYYSGIFYIRGHKAGRASIVAFAQEYATTGALPIQRALGAFSCAIVRPGGDVIFFTDNSNLHCLYVGDGAISDSFLNLVRYTNAFALDDEAVAELFALGGIFGGKTLTPGIVTSASDTVYVYSGGTASRHPKGIGDIDAPSVVDDVGEFFRDMAYALSDDKVTLSLTGGYDSRLVFACLVDQMPINVFISCSDERDPDMYWAGKAAHAGGATLELVKVPKPCIDEAYLRRLFDYADGIAPFVDDNFMRISAFMVDRRERGYSCYLTGDGGVRHKDWYWLQDLPFYRRKHTNVARFYDQRIQVIQPSIPFGKRLAGHYQTMRPRLVRRMRQYTKTLNTQSYDSIGFHVQGDVVKVKYTVHSRVVPSYAPLWELELLRYSYHLPRMKRFFYNSMREIVTARSKPIARIPTVYGTTASSEPRYLARDVVFQGIEYLRKAVRLLGRTTLRRNLFIGRPIQWSGEGDVRGLDISTQALEYCMEQEFIAAGTTLDQLSYGTLGRMIQVYLLAERAALRELEEQGR